MYLSCRDTSYIYDASNTMLRTGASTLAYLAGDQQSTSSVAIDSGTLAVTHRYYDPYGNTRGTAQPAWPEGEKGFVGGADDTATALTDLGAREYQPGTGSFISPDPLLNPQLDCNGAGQQVVQCDQPKGKTSPLPTRPVPETP